MVVVVLRGEGGRYDTQKGDRERQRERDRVTHTSPPTMVTHSPLIDLVLLLLVLLVLVLVLLLVWPGRRAGGGGGVMMIGGVRGGRS